MDVNIGLIGLGEVSRAHLEAYRSSTSVKAVAGAEPNEARRTEICEGYGLNGYATAEEMLDNEDIDIAVILTPAATHLDVAKICLAHNTPVLTEKPLSARYEDGVELVRLFEVNKVPLAYGSCYRFLPPIIRAKQLIEDGAIGDPILISEQFVGGAGADAQHVYGTHHYPEGLPGGAGMGLVDHGIHLIDIFGWLMSSKPLKVLGRGNISGQPLKTEYATLFYENGATGHLLYNDATWSTALPSHGTFSGGASWVGGRLAPPGQWEAEPGTIHVHGTLGALRIQHYTNDLYLTTQDGMRQIPIKEDGSPSQFRHQLEAFAQAISDGAAPPVSGRDGLDTLAVLHAIYKSSAADQVVSVP